MLNREISRIEEEISDTMYRGKFSYTKAGSISSSAIKTLQNYGYHVERGSQYNESYYTISWDNEVEN